MSVTDHDIDSDLQQLAQLAPEESVWPALERDLRLQRKGMAQLPGKLRFALGGGLAALLVLGVALLLYTTLLYTAFPDRGSDVDSSARDTATVGADTLRSPSAVQHSPVVQHSSAVQQLRRHGIGKYVRHLYAGDEALWDAMLEEEVNLVDQTMLYSSPQEQRKLWQYRNKLTQQLEVVRFMALPEKYLF